MTIAIIALGGNSLIHPGERGTAKQQEARVKKTIQKMKSYFKEYKVVICHGNGPAVGNLLIQQHMSKRTVPEMPMHIAVAMTQAQIGYFIQKEIANSVTVVTQIIVDPKDKAFKNPTKPIGPYYKSMVTKYMKKEPEGWRKVVASTKPLKIVELEQIKHLIKNYTVICCGGGGIPVNKKLEGVDAVIDKDYATVLLAKELKANTIIFLTDVNYVYKNYNTKKQEKIEKMTLKEAEKLLKQGTFAEGGMKPKIEASIDFLKHGGKKVLITNPDSKTKGTVISK